METQKKMTALMLLPLYMKRKKENRESHAPSPETVEKVGKSSTRRRGLADRQQ